MSLVNYSSSSSSSDEDDWAPPVIKQPLVSTSSPSKTHTRIVLPKALTKLGELKEFSSLDNTVTDEPSRHGGRVRSFKHERGNWATHVYIPVVDSLLEDVQQRCLQSMQHIVTLEPAAHFHISLSKTVVLQHHLIEAFQKSLENALTTLPPLTLSMQRFSVYANEERTRTFVALQVDAAYIDKMLRMMHAVDHVMKEFKLAKFYEQPSFHISLLWCVGDHVNALSQSLLELPSMSDNLCEMLIINVQAIHCKMGNKHVAIMLKNIC